MRTLIPAALAALALLAGCGPDCQSTCDRLFGTTAEQCNITPAGITSETDLQALTQACVAQCTSALAHPGQATYDPNERNGNQADIVMTTDKDAALWMDCVNETACQDLEAGYCAPTKNF